jgi:hypothetical protein
MAAEIFWTRLEAQLERELKRSRPTLLEQRVQTAERAVKHLLRLQVAWAVADQRRRIAS